MSLNNGFENFEKCTFLGHFGSTFVISLFVHMLFNTHPNLDSNSVSVRFSKIDNIEIKCHVDNIDNVDRIIMNLLCIT